MGEEESKGKLSKIFNKFGRRKKGRRVYNIYKDRGKSQRVCQAKEVTTSVSTSVRSFFLL